MLQNIFLLIAIVAIFGQRIEAHVNCYDCSTNGDIFPSTNVNADCELGTKDAIGEFQTSATNILACYVS